MTKHEEHPFYGQEIYRHRQEILIQNLLKKYRGKEPSEELKKAVWDELQMEKYKGHITIPFKVVMRRDSLKKYPDYIEIILDTKV